MTTTIKQENALDLQNMYREMNKFTLLSFNIIAGGMLDSTMKASPNINCASLEQIQHITHRLLTFGSPTVKEEHEHHLEKLKECLNLFEQTLNIPLTEVNIQTTAQNSKHLYFHAGS
ncbi:hypothetical protein K6U44_04145 [Vibrio parahaemolyticus]|uniref:hypothetical protein n=1 Tax=Vibrio parahaemolyticus TaxID=670 RepID=UPI001EEB9930|nr:hypothetical protein [Vibrio parahaemolyticus]MCG6459650.1 hypothetical protein [Vibrio parahaemolyticus]